MCYRTKTLRILKSRKKNPGLFRCGLILPTRHSVNTYIPGCRAETQKDWSLNPPERLKPLFGSILPHHSEHQRLLTESQFHNYCSLLPLVRCPRKELYFHLSIIFYKWSILLSILWLSWVLLLVSGWNLTSTL